MDILEKYGLHDTSINDIIINEDSIKLVFDDGIYQLKNHKECSLTKKCNFTVKITNFSAEKLYEHLEITVFRKNKFKEIDFLKFVDKLKKYCFNVIDVWYSSFSNSLLIKGFLNKERIEFLVSEISNIMINF